MPLRARFSRFVKPLRSFLAHPWRVKLLLAEALFFVVLARILLWQVPFRRLTGLFASPCRHRTVTGAERERWRKQIGWAIGRAADHLPGQTVCFPRGIAAQMMCRRRGIDTTLYYGATTLPDKGLMAHVWVQDGEAGVIGHQEAGQYQILARFPA